MYLPNEILNIIFSYRGVHPTAVLINDMKKWYKNSYDDEYYEYYLSFNELYFDQLTMFKYYLNSNNIQFKINNINFEEMLKEYTYKEIFYIIFILN
jgi:hypothetical protein